MALMAAKFEPPIAAPKVPPSTMRIEGSLRTAMMFDPSIVAPSAMSTAPTTMPMIDDAFMSARLPVRLRARRRRGGGAHERQAVDLSAARPPRQRRLEHRGPPLAHRGHDVLGGLVHEQLRLRRERHDGVGCGFDGHDQVRIEVVVLVRVTEA